MKLSVLQSVLCTLGKWPGDIRDTDRSCESSYLRANHQDDHFPFMIALLLPHNTNSSPKTLNLVTLLNLACDQFKTSHVQVIVIVNVIVIVIVIVIVVVIFHVLHKDMVLQMLLHR